jgi:para-aminobenzoate synthetase/4-amino-4-deoxychorismate lyase
MEAIYGQALPRNAHELIIEAARSVDLGRLRLTVAPKSGKGLEMELRTTPIERAIVFPGWEHAVSLRRLVVPGGLGGHKWADRDLLTKAEASFGEAVALLLDADGSVLEASRGNVFVVRRGMLFTPPADGRILPGVTRRRVLELASEVGLDVREESMALDRLLEGDEVFLTGAVRGIEPVQRLEELRSWVAGELSRVLSRKLRALWLERAGEDYQEDEARGDLARARATS